MDEITRRSILGATAFAGAATLIGAFQQPAEADDGEKPAVDNSEEADRKRVIEAGFTAEEADCWKQLNLTARAFSISPNCTRWTTTRSPTRFMFCGTD